MTSGPRRIKVLPPLVANQIAAGEVVERPASVVKELVENALDAGATRIGVELEQGGIELVRVTDDGWGIERDDLPLALAAHATSKIERGEDLEGVGTLGFRGEALASIASVSRLTIRSRARGGAASESAFAVVCEGSSVGEVRPEAGPFGTSVSVRNLFFNTPARRKFLRAPGTEQGHALDVVRQLAMVHARVAFTGDADGRRVIDLPGEQGARERVLDVLGRELEEELLEASSDGPVAIWGLVGRPSLARGTSKGQFIFVNGRSVRERTIQHALREAYRGLIDPSRHPTCVLLLELDPRAVDVNVHPAKAEVRFRDPSLVHSRVLGTIRDALRAADLTPALSHLRRPGGDGFGADAPPDARSLADALRHGPPSRAAAGGGAGGPGSGGLGSAGGDAGGGGLSVAGVRAALGVREVEPALAPATPASRVLQVHKSYLVAEDSQGITIIDQHALHERVMFEHLLARVSAGDLESQRLLAPVVVPAPAARIESLAALGPLLRRLGLDVAPIGPDSLAIHAFPSFLFERGVEPGEFLTGLLERVERDALSPDGEAALRDVLDMMACKAAVKAGDHLSEHELGELLRLRGEVERSSSCPHGRPTSIHVTIRDLEKLFGRR